MICPNCEEKFGYLHVKDRVEYARYSEFDCPKCKCRLNSMPHSRKSRRELVFLVVGGLSLFTSIVATDLLGLDGSLALTVTWGGVIASALFILLAYWEAKRSFSLYYDRVK